jgi:hypothetical protein
MNSTSYNYQNDSTYSAINFTRPTQVYYIALGLLATIGNLYLVLLFIKFSKLRATQCNWFIIFLCVSDVFIGKEDVKIYRIKSHFNPFLPRTLKILV